MPFKSSAQQRAAFSGALGPEMKKKAPQWAAETPNMSKLPAHVNTGGKKKKATPTDPMAILAAPRK
jgi:hypothetical protein